MLRWWLMCVFLFSIWARTSCYYFVTKSIKSSTLLCTDCHCTQTIVLNLPGVAIVGSSCSSSASLCIEIKFVLKALKLQGVWTGSSLLCVLYVYTYAYFFVRKCACIETYNTQSCLVSGRKSICHFAKAVYSANCTTISSDSGYLEYKFQQIEFIKMHSCPVCTRLGIICFGQKIQLWLEMWAVWHTHATYEASNFRLRLSVCIVSYPITW